MMIDVVEFDMVDRKISKLEFWIIREKSDKRKTVSFGQNCQFWVFMKDVKTRVLAWTRAFEFSKSQNLQFSKNTASFEHFKEHFIFPEIVQNSSFGHLVEYLILEQMKTSSFESKLTVLVWLRAFKFSQVQNR